MAMVSEYIFFVILFVAGISADHPKVKVYNGLLEGTYEQSYNGRTYSSFWGIPYAKPPVGELRFEPPRPPSNWTGTWMANMKHTCIQANTILGSFEIIGEEDCLYVNVFTPTKVPQQEDNMDVIVYIHGGAFMFGSAQAFADPRYLMDKDVVVVTMNYRLGPFGFMSTEDEVIPGNNGLKDQVLALQWVNKNIHVFGGNPDSVTLMGLSAGGTSVHLHYFSPLSKGLFHKGISHSGTGLSPWSFQERALAKAQELGRLLGCEDISSRNLTNCLRQRSALKIVSKLASIYKYHIFPFSPFGPVVEAVQENSFITKHPYYLLLDGEVADLPWITSITTEEGIYPAGYFYNKLEELEEKNWREIFPYMLDFEYTVPKNKWDEVFNKIKETYFENQLISKNYDMLVKLCSDRHFLVGAEKSAQLQTKATNSPVFFYILAYRGEHSLSELFHGPKDDFEGVCHGDDTFYYFFVPQLSGLKLNKQDEKMKDLYLNMITSFARNGIPHIAGIEWTPVKPEGSLNFAQLTAPEVAEMFEMEELTPREFWESLDMEDYKENEQEEKDNEESRDEL